jgi:type III restriction enzyme
MPKTNIDQLIINSPYEEPREHWKYNLNTQRFTREPGRRSAGYIQATPGANQYNDPGVFKEIPLVNEIHKRVKIWRESNYPGITGVTRKLIEHWNITDLRDNRFFFCQLDAMETLIWLTEADEAKKTGVDIQGDGGAFKRICTKLAAAKQR